VKRIVFLTALSVATALAVVVTALGATILSDPTSATKLAFAKKNLTAKAGLVTIKSKNMSAVLKHNIGLRKGTTAKSKLLIKGKVVSKGGVSKITVKLARGKYRFLCTVLGHEAGGMWGILTVK
jgi:uncharacterized cupredoxin-like copper-binding protein